MGILRGTEDLTGLTHLRGGRSLVVFFYLASFFSAFVRAMAHGAIV